MSPARTGCFKAPDRLLESRDFAYMRRRGKLHRSRHFLISVAAANPKRRHPNPSPGNRRLGLTVSRAVGNAVVRNRVKRSIREWFRFSRQRLAEDVDLVVIARRGAGTRSSREIAKELSSALRIPPETNGR